MRFFRRDSAAGLICLVLSVFLLYLTRGLPQSPLVPIGPDFYPRIVLGVTVVLSVLLIIIDVFAARAEAGKAAAPTPQKAVPKNYRLVVLTFIAFGLYVALLSWLGYRVATFLFVAILQPMLERPRRPKGWIAVIVIAAVTSLFTFLVFEEYLQVLLPRGTLTGI